MSRYRRIVSLVVLGIGILLAASAPAVSDPTRIDAASYIRTLFDATIASGDLEAGCTRFTPMARIAAGRHWRGFDAAARQAFDAEFCHLTRDALTRLGQRFPTLTLRVTHTRPGPGEMVWVHSVAVTETATWPVRWLVGDPREAPHLVDLQVLGVSLAIFLRGLAANVPDSEPLAVLAPWRRVLDLAIPPAPK
ncbi:MAG: ABC transporter substrate-binding protein [Rhodospirillaceae bacterium]|nr:ABC transporter substrate-binding protein [Rhodospirillaceae bacterium]